MPRMELTDAEAALIAKHREELRFYRAGKIEAFNDLIPHVAKLFDGAITPYQFCSIFNELKANV